MAYHSLWCSFSDKELFLLTHWHFGTEFFYLESGEASVDVEGTKYALSAHHLLIVQRVRKHATVSLSGDYRRYSMIVQSEEIERSSFSSKKLPALLDAAGGNALLVDMSDEAEDMTRIFGFFAQHGTDGGESEYRRCLMEELLILIEKHSKTKKSLSLPDSRILAVRNEIDREFTSPLSVSELAKRHFISEDHLIHEFRRVTGYSPGRYILMNRLTYAQELLLSTPDPIPIIAQKCGFGDTNHFIRTFRKQFGVPPGQYRKANR